MSEVQFFLILSSIYLAPNFKGSAGYYWAWVFALAAVLKQGGWL